MAEPLERVTPRISVNSLAEYLTAGASRRLAIIRNQKRPRTFVVAIYKEAEEAIREYLTAGDTDLQRIYRAQASLVSKMDRARSEWDRQRLDLCHQALDAYALSIEAFDLPQARVTEVPEQPPTLVVKGVEVSLRPDASFVLTRRGKEQRGFIKLYIRKQDPLTRIGGQYIGAAVYHWAAEVVKVSPAPAPELCVTHDVFAGSVYSGPRAYSRRMSDIEAACEEIALRWPMA